MRGVRGEGKWSNLDFHQLSAWTKVWLCILQRGKGRKKTIYISVQNVSQEQLLKEWGQLSNARSHAIWKAWCPWRTAVAGVRVKRITGFLEPSWAQERETHFYGFPSFSSFPVHLRYDPIFVLPPGGHRLPEHELNSHAMSLQEGPSLTGEPETPKPVQKE